MNHEQLHGHPAQYHVWLGAVCVATLSGYRDEDEALEWARRTYPDEPAWVVQAECGS